MRSTGSSQAASTWPAARCQRLQPANEARARDHLHTLIVLVISWATSEAHNTLNRQALCCHGIHRHKYPQCIC